MNGIIKVCVDEESESERVLPSKMQLFDLTISFVNPQTFTLNSFSKK